MTRKLASDPTVWLWQHTQSRTSCPARCDGGKVYAQTERTSWEYPGAWEGRPCERCGGQGYLPRVWRRAMGGAAGNAARLEALAREIKTPPVAPRARFG